MFIARPRTSFPKTPLGVACLVFNVKPAPIQWNLHVTPSGVEGYLCATLSINIPLLAELSAWHTLTSTKWATVVRN